MKRLQILCVKKENQGALNGQLTHIGGVNGTGDRWVLSVKDAILGINSQQWGFYINDKLEEIPVHIFSLDEFEKSLLAKKEGSLHNLLEDFLECP